MVPVLPTDGGRVFSSWLSLRRSKVTSSSLFLLLFWAEKPDPWSGWEGDLLSLLKSLLTPKCELTWGQA